MAKKRKKSRGQRRDSALVPTPARLHDKARQALERNDFRGATTHFKALIKEDDRPEFRAGLATAYRGRAAELAAKGMLREALAIGEVRRELCPDAPPDPSHVALLLLLGRAPDAIAYYREAEQALQPNELTSLNARLAALHLGGVEAVDTMFDADHPVLADAGAARTALQAWCDGDDEGAAHLAAQIPFRSPYRDWAQVIKALLKLNQDPAAAAAQLTRVRSDSAFSSIAEALRLVLIPEAEFTAVCNGQLTTTGLFAAALRGWSDKRLALQRELDGLAAQPDTRELSKLMWRHRDSLGDAWVRRQGLPLLVDGFPRSLKRSPLLAATPLDPVEHALLAAWREERNGHPEMVFDAWTTVIDRLGDPTPAPGSDRALQIALIQRRLDSDWNLLDYPPNPFDTTDLAGETLRGLEQSLHYDPDFQPTYLRLAALYRERRDLKRARAALEPALARWPDDPAVLLEGLRIAVLGGAFKKATGYARRILAVDPINTTARSALLDAHLAHARKLFGKGRRDLALKELTTADEWASGAQAEGRLTMLRGFITADKDPPAGNALMKQAMTLLGGSLNGQLALALEAERLHWPLHRLTSRLGLGEVKQPEVHDLLAFLRGLREALDGGHQLNSETRDYFEPTLKRGARLDLSRADAEAVCETLLRSDLPAALLAHARAASKRWPDAAIFALYAFEGEYPTNRRINVPPTACDRLEQALEQAEAAGESRVAMRLRKLLSEVTLSAGFSAPHPVDDVFGPFEDDFGATNSSSPGEVRAMIEEIGIDGTIDLLDLAGDGSGDQLRALQQVLGPDQMITVLEGMLTGTPMEELVERIGPPSAPSRKKPKRRRRKSATSPDPNDTNAKTGKDDRQDGPVQLNLFE